MGLKGYKLKRSFIVRFVGLVVPVQDNFILPWHLWSAQYNFFLTVHYFNLCVPIAQLPGQTAVQGRLSLYVCLWSRCPVDCYFIIICDEIQILNLCVHMQYTSSTPRKQTIGRGKNLRHTNAAYSFRRNC